ncbi:MAG: XRE family transcriptional regulator [Proteobacteria bacterium]|nr:XRE family transcriptional regulator [Pseudomonadota bacterium]
MIDEDQIGSRIRQLRLERGLTTTAVAQQAGISQGYLSKIENSKKAPPISTMINLAKALGVHVTDVLLGSQARTEITISRKRDRDQAAQAGKGFGYNFIPLAMDYPDRQMDPYILFPDISVEETATFHHRGEELLMVLDGAIVLKYGDEKYLLERGDAAYFNSGLPHAARIVESKPAQLLAVIWNSEPGMSSVPGMPARGSEGPVSETD